MGREFRVLTYRVLSTACRQPIAKSPMTQHRIQRGEMTLACAEYGAGTPVVLVHGFPLDHTMWQPQIDALQATCRVIAIDLRGFGNSTLATDDASAGVDMQVYAADILATLDEIGIREPAILCGFSMGGYVLWQFVLANPQRVRAIVVCDSRADVDSEEKSRGRLKMAEEVLQTGAEPVANTMLPKLLARETIASRQSLAEQVWTMICRASPKAIAAAQRGMARRPDVRSQLREIDKPALMLVGVEDALSPPEHMREIANSLPEGRIVEIPAAGHMTTVENPAAVNESIRDFFASL